MELWNMMASDGASCFAHCFSILFGMLSGPDALDRLMFLSSFSTPSVFIFIDGIVDFRFMWISGMLSTLPLVNTQENCFIHICAFSLLWLTSFPFPLDVPLRYYLVYGILSSRTTTTRSLYLYEQILQIIYHDIFSSLYAFDIVSILYCHCHV